MQMNELQTQALSVGYHGVPLIKEINVSLQAGKIVTLIGPNGAGKSTILKSISKQLKPISGVIYLKGKDMTKVSEKELAKCLSMVTTEKIKTEWMTCRDVIVTGRYPYTGKMGKLSQADEDRITYVIERFQMEHIAQQNFMELSDGQKQRVMLARAFCQEPAILVLDEPTSYLDIKYKLELLSLVRKLAKNEKIAVVMSLHELELAVRVSDTLVCVKKDQIWKQGTPEQICKADTIANLYDIPERCFHAMTGMSELMPVLGKPVYFVIGGGGSGLPWYHKLQREGIPFAVGVLHENDVEYATAAALASKIITEQAYEIITEEHLQQAMEQMKACEKVICTVEHFGICNQANQKLLQAAKEWGSYVTQWEDEQVCETREEKQKNG